MAGIEGGAPGEALRANGFLGLFRAPETIHWTPLLQECGCVIAWCMQMVDTSCPWHGGESGRPLPEATRGTTVNMRDPSGSVSYFVRAATGDDVALGKRLAGQLHELMQKVLAGDEDAMLAEIPPPFLAWLIGAGYDPVNAWLDQQLVNIILNRGGGEPGPAFPEMLAQLDEQAAGG